jgi:hypothetical protein
MGAWGAGSFENDDASDWLADFCDDPQQERISDALAGVAGMGAGEFLEAPDCSIALAAAEIVAALKGAPLSTMPDELKECLATLNLKADSGMISSALKITERIRTDSELKDLWVESDGLDAWTAAMSNLEARLKQ